MRNEITEMMTGGRKPQQLRRELQEGKSDDLWRRRAVIGLSLLGMGAMAAVSLFQTGVLVGSSHASPLCRGDGCRLALSNRRN